MPLASKGRPPPGNSSWSVPPDQPTQVPWRSCRTGSRAVTRPPGLLRQETSPSALTTRSTGRRLATTTNALASVTAAIPPPGEATLVRSAYRADVGLACVGRMASCLLVRGAILLGVSAYDSDFDEPQR